MFEVERSRDYGGASAHGAAQFQRAPDCEANLRPFSSHREQTKHLNEPDHDLVGNLLELIVIKDYYARLICRLSNR